MTFILWIGLALAVGVGASNRYGREGLGWFFLSLIISTLLGFAFLLAAGPKAPKQKKLVQPPRTPTALPANADLDAVISSLRT